MDSTASYKPYSFSSYEKKKKNSVTTEPSAATHAQVISVNSPSCSCILLYTDVCYLLSVFQRIISPNSMYDVRIHTHNIIFDWVLWCNFLLLFYRAFSFTGCVTVANTYISLTINMRSSLGLLESQGATAQYCSKLLFWELWGFPPLQLGKFHGTVGTNAGLMNVDFMVVMCLSKCECARKNIPGRSRNREEFTSVAKPTAVRLKILRIRSLGT